MGLKLGSEGGVPRAPPPTRLVPDGQVAVAIRGGLCSVATPEADALSTTVWAGHPVEHMAKLVTWSPPRQAGPQATPLQTRVSTSKRALCSPSSSRYRHGIPQQRSFPPVHRTDP